MSVDTADPCNLDVQEDHIIDPRLVALAKTYGKLSEQKRSQGFAMFQSDMLMMAQRLTDIHRHAERTAQRSMYLAVRRYRLFTIPVLAICLAALIVSGWNRIFDYVGPQDAEERTNLLTAVAQAAGGAVLATGLFFSARTYLTAREGQITERFSRAIDHLGSDSLPTRLGGIYALERIARDSSRDQRQVVEVLTAYVRENSPAVQERFSASARNTHKLEGERPAIDIQAIATVLGRRERGPDRQDTMDLDLSASDLRWINWQGANLVEAFMVLSDLESGSLVRCDLTNALLSGCILRDGVLRNTTLRGCDLDSVTAVRADFRNADLQDAVLTGASFLGSNFEQAMLQGIAFDECDLSQVSFKSANLTGADFSLATVDETDFSEAVLTNANFEGVNLSTCIGLRGCANRRGSGTRAARSYGKVFKLSV